jgi:hypothetical protein
VIPGTILFPWKLPEASTSPACSHTTSLWIVVGVGTVNECGVEIPSVPDGTKPAIE